MPLQKCVKMCLVMGLGKGLDINQLSIVKWVVKSGVIMVKVTSV